MNVECKCEHCGKDIVVNVPDKDYYNPDFDCSLGNTCNDCVPSNSAARDGINESIYTEVINIKNKLPTWEEIERMIEEEFRNNPLVEDVRPIEISDPSIRGKYSTRLDIDEKLDDIVSIRVKVKQFVDEEIFNAFIEATNDYINRIKRMKGDIEQNESI